MISCENFSERVSDYLDGSIAPRQRLVILLHLFLCGYCRRYLRRFRLSVGLVRDTQPLAEPDDQQIDELVTRIKRRAG